MRSPTYPALSIAAPLRWHLLEQYNSSLLVSVSTWHAPGYTLTSEVEVVRDSWELGAVNGPLDPDQDDAAELVADVARWAQGGTALYGEGLLMLTAETITDEQIRELREDTLIRGDRCISDREIVALCEDALGNLGYGDMEVTDEWVTSTVARARARCAQILNARVKAGQP